MCEVRLAAAVRRRRPPRSRPSSRKCARPAAASTTTIRVSVVLFLPDPSPPSRSPRRAPAHPDPPPRAVPAAIAVSPSRARLAASTRSTVLVRTQSRFPARPSASYILVVFAFVSSLGPATHIRHDVYRSTRGKFVYTRRRSHTSKRFSHQFRSDSCVFPRTGCDVKSTQTIRAPISRRLFASAETTVACNDLQAQSAGYATGKLPRSRYTFSNIYSLVKYIT